MTDDIEFHVFCGAELITDIAHFFASLATYSPERQRYEIRGVVGSDEFHEAVDSWDEISRRMFVPLHDEEIIIQFEGYKRLEELDWNRYRQNYGDIRRVDRILEAEGDTPNRYKVNKQADVLMLFFLFSAEELAGLFERLDYGLDPQTIPRNIEYYIARTSNGSTLSRVVHAWVLSRSNRQRSWKDFQRALRGDVADIPRRNDV